MPAASKKDSQLNNKLCQIAGTATVSHTAKSDTHRNAAKGWSADIREHPTELKRPQMPGMHTKPVSYFAVFAVYRMYSWLFMYIYSSTFSARLQHIIPKCVSSTHLHPFLWKQTGFHFSISALHEAPNKNSTWTKHQPRNKREKPKHQRCIWQKGRGRSQEHCQASMDAYGLHRSIHPCSTHLC